MKIAILTPTFNREKLLPRLYGTLLKQSDRDFVWIVVDDGSSDGTEQLVSGYRDSGEIEIRYFKKANGGKVSALNCAFETFDDVDFFAVVDSDDELLPEGVGLIRKKVEQYDGSKDVGAVFFRYRNTDGSILRLGKGTSLNEELVLSRYEHDNRYSKDDGCIGYYARAVNKYKYPVFGGEKYVGPTVIQLLMAREFRIAFTQEVVGIAEYQPDGLSRSGRKLRLNNPQGMIVYCGLMSDKRNMRFFNRIGYFVMAQAYAAVSNTDKETLMKNGIDPKCLKGWAFIPGRILGCVWKKKYLNDR